MSGRVFGASLKPAWTETQINEFLDKTRGDVIVYVINHDKDDTESHTHIYLEYTNPRKVSTVANLLGVESNFIEIIRNKKGYLRYLTHMDDDDKHRYDENQVYTNNDVPYKNQVLGNSMSDKEIAEYLAQGKGMDLLGIVPAGKLRTIQGFLHFESSNKLLTEIKRLSAKMDELSDTLGSVKMIADSFVNSVDASKEEMLKGFQLIADSISAVFGTSKRRIR